MGLAACASTQSPQVAPGTTRPEQLRLSLEYAVDVDSRPSPHGIIELRAGETDETDETDRVMQRLHEIVRELAATVADSLSRSTAVKWVLTRPDPHLSPDHTLQLLLRNLHWVEGVEENTEIPGAHLIVTLTRIADGALLWKADTWATGIELYKRRARDLDLRSLYRNAAEQIVELVESQ